MFRVKIARYDGGFIEDELSLQEYLSCLKDIREGIRSGMFSAATVKDSKGTLVTSMMGGVSGNVSEKNHV